MNLMNYVYNNTQKQDGAIRQRVIRARAVQQQRFGEAARVTCNAAMRASDVQRWCRLGDEAQAVMKMAINELNFSARSYDRILKVARTIADLAGSDSIELPHVTEAIQYRSLDRGERSG